MYNIHCICLSYCEQNTKIIKDEILTLLVFGMVAVDLIILCIYFGNVYSVTQTIL